MSNEEKFDLPSSGLAEDILAQFIRTAQVEVNQVNTAEQKDRLETLLHLVTFQLGKEEYGVEIASVQEIIRATDITPVPGAPSHVRGVINLRGKIIPVVDLRTRFALPQAETSDSQRIVVVELCQKRIGMLVDSVSQVIKVPAGVVEEMPEEATSVDGNYIKGVGKLENRLVVILDLNKSLLLS
ncbi:MAG: chemotaxis protein CheW [Deltaproteobacteria bacterium HGW-Deltaproteobacteria-23]|nr:MAG: chemotaxis protein CheW [Deltaproteobacteria bacterium HGW-Deltaproteobacteria-23]